MNTTEQKATTKHTPAPWGVAGSDLEMAGEVVATAIAPDGASWEEQHANARLIAAAPHLLHALKHALRWHDQLAAVDLNHMRDAIARAEGRPQ